MTLSERESELAKGISGREGALLEDLRRMVAIPTGGGHAPGLDETRGILTARLAALGARVELVPGSARPQWLHGERAGRAIPPTAICRRPSRSERTRLLLSGHLDTVHDPRGAFDRLTVSPDGKTGTGPGVVDMKGGLVIAVHALEALAAAGMDVHWTFVLNSDEETGSYHSEGALRAVAHEADFGLVLEPAMANGGLVVDRPGSGQFMIETRGRAAHVGRDFAAGVSAVNALAAAVLEVGKMAEPSRGTIVNVGPLEGGVATNVVPDRARAWGNVRFKTPELGRELEARVQALATPGEALPATKVFTSFNRPAKPLTPLVQKLADAARSAAEDLGQKLPFGATGGVCDGNILQDEGLATIDTLGVRGGGLHTPEEWIEIPSLVERCQMLALLMARLGG